MGQLKLEVQPEYIEATIGWCIELTELHISYNCIIQNLSSPKYAKFGDIHNETLL